MGETRARFSWSIATPSSLFQCRCYPQFRHFLLVVVILIKVLWVVVCLLVPFHAFAGKVYKCKEKGQTIFSEKPCSDQSGNVEEIDLKPIPKQSSSDQSVTESYSDYSAQSSLDSVEIDIANIERNIKRLKAKRNSLQKKRDEKIELIIKKQKGGEIELFKAKSQIRKARSDYSDERSRLSKAISKKQKKLSAKRKELSTKKSAVRRAAAEKKRKGRYVDSKCPCSGPVNCVGPKGGKYCITLSGKKDHR